jgi:surfeit locus 1 family protein
VTGRLLVPALSTFVMLVVLLGLGTWQVRRLAWKRGLLAQIDAAEQAPAQPLTGDPAPFAKVTVAGRLRGDRAALYGADVRDERSGPVLGGQLIEPLERQGSETVLVDLGWVPQADWRRYAADGPAGIDGYARPADHPGWFSPADDPAQRLFYTLDPAAIGAALGLPGVAPFTLVALGPTPAHGFPDPAHALPRPPNNHLQYAFTWYGLALVLLVIFVSYARKGVRA